MHNDNILRYRIIKILFLLLTYPRGAGSSHPLDSSKSPPSVNEYVSAEEFDGIHNVYSKSRPLPISEIHREDSRECNIAQLFEDAQILNKKLEALLSILYFRVFRVNLDSKCRTRQRNDLCASVNNATDISSFILSSYPQTDDAINLSKCQVDRCNISEVPTDLQTAKMEHFVLRYPANTRDNWDPVELYGKDLLYNDILGVYPSTSLEPPVFVDLSRNPPSYTGYHGHNDWKMIYEESNHDKVDVPCQQSSHLYKLISGMQSCIAATSSWNYECVNPLEAYQLQTELPRYRSNKDFYYDKLGNHSDRLENLYYTFQTLLKATCKLAPVLTTFARKLEAQDSELQNTLIDLLNTHFSTCKKLEPATHSHTHNLEHTKCYICNDNYHLDHPFLLRKFQNITKIIECVDCEKCRLHAKVKLAALQIAIRAFSSEGSLQVLERNEIVSFLHGLYYFSESVLIVRRFSEQRRRQIMLYPIRFMLAALLFLIVLYRRELFYAMFYCTLVDENNYYYL